MRSEWLKIDDFTHLLAALMPYNRLALEISAATGLRIGDVLNLRTATLARRMSVRELKTGKYRRIYLPLDLYERALGMAGKIYVFPGRNDQTKHRTVSAVYKDLRRVAELFRISGKQIDAHISPHSARKIYAVREYRASGGNLKHVQKLLNHSSEAVTMLYAMADVLSERKKA